MSFINPPPPLLILDIIKSFLLNLLLAFFHSHQNTPLPSSIKPINSLSSLPHSTQLNSTQTQPPQPPFSSLTQPNQTQPKLNPPSHPSLNPTSPLPLPSTINPLKPPSNPPSHPSLNSTQPITQPIHHTPQILSLKKKIHKKRSNVQNLSRREHFSIFEDFWFVV